MATQSVKCMFQFIFGYHMSLPLGWGGKGPSRLLLAQCSKRPAFVMILGCVFAHNVYLHISEGTINAERFCNYLCSHPYDVFFRDIPAFSSKTTPKHILHVLQHHSKEFRWTDRKKKWWNTVVNQLCVVVFCTALKWLTKLS